MFKFDGRPYTACDVRLQRERFSTVGADVMHECVRIFLVREIVDADRSTCLSKSATDGRADAGAAAGDQCFLAVKDARDGARCSPRYLFHASHRVVKRLSNGVNWVRR